MILAVENLTRTYPSGAGLLTVLDQVSFQVALGETLAVMGPSGSGKTTLISLCAGLDQPSGGRILLEDQDLGQLSERARSELRNRKIGFVFQSFHLIPTLTALENVLVPAELAGRFDQEDQARAFLTRVGLAERMNHFPSQMSGGEQQRVAIARAFINQPKIVFADEPTGNLDDRTSETIEDLLFEMNREMGTTLVIVTHDAHLAQKTHRILSLRIGRVDSESSTSALEHSA